MNTNEIIDAIKELPLLSVFKIAFIDDIILFTRLWPFWLGVLAIFIVIAIIEHNKN